MWGVGGGDGVHNLYMCVWEVHVICVCVWGGGRGEVHNLCLLAPNVFEHSKNERRSPEKKTKKKKKKTKKKEDILTPSLPQPVKFPG